MSTPARAPADAVRWRPAGPNRVLLSAATGVGVHEHQAERPTTGEEVDVQVRPSSGSQRAKQRKPTGKEHLTAFWAHRAFANSHPLPLSRLPGREFAPCRPRMAGPEGAASPVLLPPGNGRSAR